MPRPRQEELDDRRDTRRRWEGLDAHPGESKASRIERRKERLIPAQRRLGQLAYPLGSRKYANGITPNGKSASSLGPASLKRMPTPESRLRPKAKRKAQAAEVR